MIWSSKCRTHINRRHRWIGHVGALQFEFRIQPKRNGEAHVDGGTHVHETRAQIEENLLRNKTTNCEIVSFLHSTFDRRHFVFNLRTATVAPNGMFG